ncbi:PepSY domain-containing protein [Actinoplanes sp. NPDC049681]|uniref:PepSY domain-containing protein n=1 Tax=Actinoplanes sp. NPDC049681 TaxID=3363905 RepID=UPI00378C603D
MKLKLIIPAGLLLLGGLSACSSDPAAPATQPAGNQQQAADAPAQTSGQPSEEADDKEEPLTGETKEKAEKAALAKFPGTVKKSEHDVENPGLYAVEIEQDAGGEIEVYLDKDFTVVKTKKEDGTEDGD